MSGFKSSHARSLSAMKYRHAVVRERPQEPRPTQWALRVEMPVPRALGEASRPRLQDQACCCRRLKRRASCVRAANISMDPCVDSMGRFVDLDPSSSSVSDHVQHVLAPKSGELGVCADWILMEHRLLCFLFQQRAALRDCRTRTGSQAFHGPREAHVQEARKPPSYFCGHGLSTLSLAGNILLTRKCQTTYWQTHSFRSCRGDRFVMERPGLSRSETGFHSRVAFLHEHRGGRATCFACSVCLSHTTQLCFSEGQQVATG